MNYKDLLERIIQGFNLSQEDAASFMEEVMNGKLTPAQIAAVLIALRMKGETEEEIAGFALTMRKWVRPLESQRSTIVDTCGTGGDGAKTFNISTLSAFVAAGAGIAIAKHGNVAVSSQCGSADLLKALGVKIESDPVVMGHALDEVGICFLFAPIFHPAMKHAGVPRKEIGVRTVFNILGPLTNPASAKAQVLGVYRKGLVELMARVLLRLGSNEAFVVHGEDGLDEVTTTAPTTVAHLENGKIENMNFTPESLGINRASLDDLKGGTITDNLKIAQSVLDGGKGPPRDIVLINAAFSILVGRGASSLEEAIQKASESLDSGKALQKLKQLVAFTNRALRLETNR